MQIKSKISKRLFVCFPSVVDRPLTVIRKVDGSIPIQGIFISFLF